MFMAMGNAMTLLYHTRIYIYIYVYVFMLVCIMCGLYYDSCIIGGSQEGGRRRSEPEGVCTGYFGTTSVYSDSKAVLWGSRIHALNPTVSSRRSYLLKLLVH